MSSWLQAGCRTGLRRANSATYGFTSRTGVPSMASSPQRGEGEFVDGEQLAD